MTFLISSKYLSTELRKFGEGLILIDRLSIYGDALTISSVEKSHTIYLENTGRKEHIVKTNCRWDFLLQNLEAMPEQPLFFEVNEKCVRFTFQF